MRILVTGGAGFIGSHVAEAYLRAGHDVAVLDDLSSGKLENVAEGIRMFQGDVCDPDSVRRIFDVFAPDVVSHHAGHVSVSDSVSHPDIDCAVNVQGSLVIFQAAVHAGVQRIIFASSGGAVYGSDSVRPTPEDAALRPESPYAIAKVAGELYLGYFAGSLAQGAVILRYANVYGPRQSGSPESGVVSILCERALRRQSLTINGDGLQTRDFIYVGDVARANILALSGPAGTYNIGTGHETTICTLADRVEAIAGAHLPVERCPARPAEVRDSAVNVERAARMLGFNVEYSLEEGLERTVQYIRQHMPVC